MKLKKRKLEIKHYWSPDIHNPWCWEPIDNNVFYLLEMNIGMTDDNASDIYSVMIATVDGIYSLKNKKHIVNKFYKLILVDEYSWGNIVSILNSMISNIDVKREDSISAGLRNCFYWEYESMK